MHEGCASTTVDSPEMTNTLDEASIILQPIRYRIYQELKKGSCRSTSLLSRNTGL